MVMGGRTKGGSKLNDVWKSTNGGASFIAVAAAARWSARQGHNCLGYQSLVVVAGGHNNQSESEVWYSADEGVSWTQLSNPQFTNRVDFSMFVVQGRLMVSGGRSTTTWLSDAWSLVITSPASAAPFPATGASVSLTSAGLAVSWTPGDSPGSRVSSYVVTCNGESSNTTSIPAVTACGGAQLLQSVDITVEAQNDVGSTLSAVMTATVQPPGSWQSLSSFERLGENQQVLADVSGNMLILGGADKDCRTLSSVWRPSTSTPYGSGWTSHSAMPRRRGGMCVETLAGYKLLVFGGDDSAASPTQLRDVIATTNLGASWYTVCSTAAWSARAHAASVVYDGDKVMIMGGGYRSSATSETVLNDVYTSNNHAGTWSRRCATPGWAARLGLRAAIISDGTVFIVGGGKKFTVYDDLWKSSNYGVTWSKVGSNNARFRRIFHGFAALGTALIMFGGNTEFDRSPTHTSTVWTSTDMGVTWVSGSSTGLPSGAIRCRSSGNLLRMVFSETIRNGVDLGNYCSAALPSVYPWVVTASEDNDSPASLFYGMGAAGPPSMPRGVTVAPVSGGIRVAWQPPLGFGFVPLTSYDVTCECQHCPQLTGTRAVGIPSASSLTLDITTSHPDKANYMCIVSATNSLGTGPAGGTPYSDSPIPPWLVPSAEGPWAALAGAGLASLGSRVVLAGGRAAASASSAQVWASADDGATWTAALAPMNAPRAYFPLITLRSGRGGGGGTSLVALGGARGSRGSEVLLRDVIATSNISNAWSISCASAGWSARKHHAAAAVASTPATLIVVAGDDGVLKRDVWRSTNSGGSWSRMSAHSPWSARAAPALAQVSGTLVLGGGVSGGVSDAALTTWLHDVWTSNDDGAAWTRLSATSWAFDWATAHVSFGQLVVTATSTATSTGVVVFSADLGATWAAAVPVMPAPATVWGAAVLAPSGRVVMVRGQDVANSSLSSTVYNQETAVLPAAVVSVTAAATDARVSLTWVLPTEPRGNWAGTSLLLTCTGAAACPADMPIADPTTVSHTFAPVTNGQTYVFAVAILNAHGSSPPTAAAGTTPTAVWQPMASPVSGSSAALSQLVQLGSHLLLFGGVSSTGGVRTNLFTASVPPTSWSSHTASSLLRKRHCVASAGSYALVFGGTDASGSDPAALLKLWMDGATGTQ